VACPKQRNGKDASITTISQCKKHKCKKAMYSFLAKLNKTAESTKGDVFRCIAEGN
jgi:hypothetical protein